MLGILVKPYARPMCYSRSLLLKHGNGFDETHELCRAYMNIVELVSKCVENRLDVHMIKLMKNSQNGNSSAVDQ